MAEQIAQSAALEPEPVQPAIPERITGRTVHVDGDYLAYFASGGDDMPVGIARRVARERVEAFRDMSGSDQSVIHLTASGSNKGQRRLIATVKDYQGQRAGKHPRNWQYLRDYLEWSENLPGLRRIWDDREADDAMGLATATQDPVRNVVIATRDKDMRMLPGTHINWVDYTIVQVPLGAYEVIGDIDGETYGHKWFWLQMLQGDTADNIPGLEYLDGRRVGHGLAAKALAGTTCNQEAYEVVSRGYQGCYDETWEDRLVEQAALLWMRRDDKASIGDFLSLGCFSPGVIRATNRLVQRVQEADAEIKAIYARAASQEAGRTAA
jgi:DNA polymerase-1